MLRPARDTKKETEPAQEVERKPILPKWLPNLPNGMPLARDVGAKATASNFALTGARGAFGVPNGAT